MSRHQSERICPKCKSPLAFAGGVFRCNPCGVNVQNPAAHPLESDQSKDEQIRDLSERLNRAVMHIDKIERQNRDLLAKDGNAEAFSPEVTRLQSLLEERGRELHDANGALAAARNEVLNLQDTLALMQQQADKQNGYTSAIADELAAVRTKLGTLAADDKITKNTLIAEIGKLSGSPAA